MTMKIKYVVILVTALLAGAFIVGRYSTKKERSSLNEAIIALNDTITHRTVTINGLQHQVFEKDQVIISERTAKEAGLVEIDRLKALNIKRLKENTDLKVELEATKKELTLPDTVFITKKEQMEPGKTYLKLPFGNHFNDDYLTLTTWINTDHTWGFDMFAPINLNITVGDKKTGFLKTEPKVIIDTPNPYVIVQDINYVSVQKKKLPWWGQALITIAVWESAEFGVRKMVGK